MEFPSTTLAVIFAGSGTAKSIMSPGRMAATGQTGVAGLSLPFIRFIAICELLGAAGMVLPEVLRVYPILTSVAAIGLAIIMLGAARIHARLHEPKNVAINLFLFFLSGFVACGRR